MVLKYKHLVACNIFLILVSINVFLPKLNSNDEWKIDYLLQSKPLIKSKILWHKIKPQKGPLDFLKKNNESLYIVQMKMRHSN